MDPWERAFAVLDTLGTWASVALGYLAYRLAKPAPAQAGPMRPAPMVSRRRQSDPSNLVTLCPNCHRLADRRKDQVRFKRALKERYAGSSMCALCGETRVLEAAHIRPWSRTPA